MRFRFLGTEIYVSFLFVAVVAFMLCVDRTGLVIPTLLAVLVHETGHLFAMWLTECNPKSIRLVPASVRITRSFAAAQRKEWLITLMGPAMNLTVALVLGVNYHLSGNVGVLEFAVLNVILGLFNLLPVRGLDGGTAVRMILCRYSTPDFAEKVLQIITLITALAALTVGIIFAANGEFNPSVFIVALYFAVAALLKR